MCAHAGPRAPSQKTDLTLRVISTALNRVDSAEAPEQGGNVAVQADTHTAEGPRTSAECGRPIRAPLPHPTHGGRGSGEPDRWVCEESQISGSVRYSCYQGSDHWPQPGPCCSHPVTHQGLVRTPCHPPHLATPPLSGRPGIWACHEVQPISQQSKAWDPARTLTHTHICQKAGPKLDRSPLARKPSHNTWIRSSSCGDSQRARNCQHAAACMRNRRQAQPARQLCSPAGCGMHCCDWRMNRNSTLASKKPRVCRTARPLRRGVQQQGPTSGCCLDVCTQQPTQSTGERLLLLAQKHTCVPTNSR